MSEEQPQFKVTDRRLFNADGTPRELAEQDAADKKESDTPAQNVEERQSAQGAASGQQAVDRESPVSADLRDIASQAESAPETEEDVAGADDPASFVNFLMSIASNAATALGMMAHPVTGESGVDLQLGKHWIDVLGMLQQKTRGNLSAQEHQILEGLLADLRMQFVSLTNTAPPKQRFTGRDILGGK